MNNDLIFGKSGLEKIVAIQPDLESGFAEVFIENSPGIITSEFVKNKYWVVASQKLRSNMTRLEGNLHYKWGFQTTSRSDFMKFRMFNKDKDIYSVYNAAEALCIKDGYTMFKGMVPGDLSVLSFDLETTGINLDDNLKLLLISNTYRAGTKVVKKLFSFDEYQDEGEMIQEWCKWVREMNPSIILGHNVLSYDIPVLQYITERYGNTLPLGRDGSDAWFEAYSSRFRVDGSRDQAYNKVHVYGRSVIDTLFLAIRYDAATKKYESYGLKNIIKQEGLEKFGRQFYDASTIRKNYMIPEEWEKIKVYCIDDSDDALALFDLMVPAQFYFCQSVPKTFQNLTESATGAQINSMLIRSYIQQRHSLPKASASKPFEGAISFGPAGIYKNVLKIDVSGMYPSIMREYKVYDKDKDPKGYFLELVEYFSTERLKNKKLWKETGNKYYNDIQETQKVATNSMYGFLATDGLLFNSPDCAEFITAKGREILRMTIKWATSREYEDWNPSPIVVEEDNYEI